jgi:hypothetical protein
MIPELSELPMPDWLANASAESMRDEQFSVRRLLQDSLYYPACGLDGDPVRLLAGHVYSFVYVDYGISGERFREDLAESGFRGYHLLGRRGVTQAELVPDGWTPVPPESSDGDPSVFREGIKTPFCEWLVFERDADRSDDHGPSRFSLLFLCADGVAAFQALYVGNRVSPRMLAILQPGHAFGGNWTNFCDENKIFARTVLSNPAGVPEYLLNGGIGRDYAKPIWGDFGERIATLRRADGGKIVIWRQGEEDTDSLFASIGNRGDVEGR